MLFTCIALSHFKQAFAEEMHERVRKDFWAYSVDEQFNPKQLHQVKYDVSCFSALIIYSHRVKCFEAAGRRLNIDQ
jgi:cobalamin-dependent methionine synthase I